MSQETASYWQSPSSREKNLQKLRAQIHGRGLRQARRGGSLHPAQSQDRQIHHILPLYRQVTVIWNWYKNVGGHRNRRSMPMFGLLAKFHSRMRVTVVTY